MLLALPAPLPARGRRRQGCGRARCHRAALGLALVVAVRLLLPPAHPGRPAPGASAAAVLSPAADVKTGPSAVGVVDWARNIGSAPARVAVITLCEVCAILVCMPGYSAFEYASGAIFGFWFGALVVSVAKIIAALIAFALIRTLRDSPVGRWAQQRVQGGPRGESRWAERLQKGIERNGFRFCLLVRCSLLPAWLSNYGLPLAGVPFSSYLPASVLGMLPPVLVSVYAGATAASLASALGGSGGAVSSSNLFGMAAVGLSALSTALLARQLSSYALEETESAAERLGADGPQSTTAAA